MAKFPFTPAQSDEPARWLVERLTTFGADVLSIVPSGFEAYARVFHPASRVTYTSDGGARSFSDVSEPLRWSEVAALTERRAHRAMQWPSIQGANPSLHDYTVLKAGDVVVEGPEEGSLPIEVARALWPVLEPHTKTREVCFFAVWEGFGCLPRTVSDAPAFEIPARKFHLFTGPLEAVEETFCTANIEDALSGGYMTLVDPDAGEPGVEETAQVMSRDVFVAISSDEPTPEEIEAALEHLLASQKPMYQSANLWWPEDRAWCVATEIDFNTTYIAGAQRLVDALLACEALEVYQVEPTDGVAYDGDTLNPAPSDPYGGSFRLV